MLNILNSQKLIQLIQENPELEVLPLVSPYCIPEEGKNYWVSNLGVEEIYVNKEKEKIYIKSIDMEELIDEKFAILVENLSVIEFLEVREYWEEEAEKQVNNLPWKKVILVYIEERTDKI